jgi:hypothetical protein
VQLHQSRGADVSRTKFSFSTLTRGLAEDVELPAICVLRDA